MHCLDWKIAIYNSEINMFEPDISSTQFEASTIFKDIQTKQEADPFCANIIA